MDKLASQNKGVKYLLVAVDVFSRFVRVQTMKTKYAKDTLQAFKKMFSRKNTPEKFWVDKGTEYGGTFRKFCKEKSIEVYSTMTETKIAFAERAIQSLKHVTQGLRSGGPRGSHVADRPDQHLRARQPWGPPHGNPVDGSIWRKGSTRPPEHESDEVEKRGSLRE